MSYLPRNRRVVNLLRIFWVIIALWYEYFAFRASARSCKWPDARTNKLRNAEGVPPAHILIVADPQILDHRSYPGRSPFLTYLTRLVVDLNLRKNWGAAIAKNPDAVVFLGDMMDGGRMNMTDTEYEVYYSRFKSIFHSDPRIPQYFIPGNHDIGLRSSSLFSPHARTRYISHFGPLNNQVSVSNHTLVFFDALGFVEEDYERKGQKKSFPEWRPKAGGSFEFLKKFHEEQDLDPVVFFTHIPLYRPDGKPCGPLREKGTIRPGIGFGYQNTLGKDSTSFVLSMARPVVAFSGDDHDYCEHVHQSVISHPVREVTVKSLSMAMNVRKPAFQLLSLFPAPYWDDIHPTYADTPCILPDQLGIYLGVYLPCLALSLFLVFFASAIRGRGKRHHDRDAITTASQNKHLPDPVTNTARNQTSIVCFGQRRRLPLGLGLFFNARGSSKTLLRSVLHDVRDIAVFPIGIFVAVTIWVSLL